MINFDSGWHYPKMKFRLKTALAALALSVAVPGIALAQSSSGFRWGAPWFGDRTTAAEEEEAAQRPDGTRPDRPYGPRVIQANPQNIPPAYRQPESRAVPGSSSYDQDRPPSGLGAQGQEAHGSAANPQKASVSALPPEDQPEIGEPKQLPPQFQKQLVDYPTKEPAGTLIIDTGNTFLYLVLGDGKAMRYGIGVGREGFTWSGAERVSRMAEWPDWYPPSEMIERQPYLPRFMAGGEGNPLGARALYLGKTLYRIHGTNQPSTIGTFVSSGCIRLTNRDIEDLYSRVQVGTRVVVLPSAKPAETASAAPAGPSQAAPGGGASQATPQGQPLPGYIPSVGASSSGAGLVNIAPPNSIQGSPLPPAR